MKQRLLSLVLAAALLAGCSAPAAGTADTIPDTAGSVSGRGEEPAAETAVTTGLHVLSAGDENGFYSAGSSVDAGMDRLNYVDYATLTAAPLCADPACTHNSDSCTARLPEGQTLYGVKIVDENRLVLMAARSPDYWPVLYTTARDGSDRQLLYEGSATAYLSVGNSLLMGDGEYVYFCVTEEDPEDPALSGGLYRVPVTGGEAQRLFTTTNHTMVGVVDGRILCVVYDLTDGTGAGTRHLRLYDLDGSYTDLMEWTDADPGRSFAVDGDRILWLDQSGTAGWLTLDGSSGQVTPEWPFAVGTGEGEKLLNPDSRTPVLDGQLMITATGLDSNAVADRDRYALDPDTGTLTQLPLSYVAGEQKRPIDLVARVGDKVLCTFAVNWEPAEYVSEDGTNTDTLQGSTRIGLLSLEDLRAGNPNYEEITCTCPMVL